MARAMLASVLALGLVGCEGWFEPDSRCQGVPLQPCRAAADEALGSVAERDRDAAEIVSVRRTASTTCNAADTPLYDVEVRLMTSDVWWVTTVGHSPSGDLVVCQS